MNSTSFNQWSSLFRGLTTFCPLSLVAETQPVPEFRSISYREHWHGNASISFSLHHFINLREHKVSILKSNSDQGIHNLARRIAPVQNNYFNCSRVCLVTQAFLQITSRFGYPPT